MVYQGHCRGTTGAGRCGGIVQHVPEHGRHGACGDNPFYDKPSDMQRFGSVFNAGLQAYGQYSQAAKAEAMERVKNDLTAAIQSQGNAFKSMGRSDIQAAGRVGFLQRGTRVVWRKSNRFIYS